jgi:hypothetical protein
MMADWFVDNMNCKALTGTVTMTNGSTTVTGVGSLFVSECAVNGRTKLQADAAGEMGANWATISVITDDTHITLAAAYAGTGGAGTAGYSTNAGTSVNNAWIHANDALIKAGIGQNDVIWLRRGQTHLFSNANVAVALTNTYGNCVTVKGDDGTKWAGEGGLARTILSLQTYGKYFGMASKFFLRFEDLHFYQSAAGTYGIWLISTGSTAYFYNCKFEQDGNGSVEGGMISVSSTPGPVICELCDFNHDGAGTGQNPHVAYSQISLYNCTVDGGKCGFNGNTMGFMENCVFGEDSDFGVAALRLTSGLGIPWRIRNVKFGTHCTTEFSFATGSYDYQFFNFLGLFQEDYDGVKGAWHSENPYFGDELAVASAGTVAGQRAGGAVTVIKVTADNIGDHAYWHRIHPVAEFGINTAAGTYTVDVWTQPNGWAAVPVTQGAAADLWVVVLAWDTATGKYVEFDSRNEGSQDPQVNDAWHKIRLTNVVNDLPGLLIVRTFCKHDDPADYVYVDRTVDIA